MTPPSRPADPANPADPQDPLPRATESPIETLSSDVAYETPWIRVRKDQVRRQDGSTGSYGYVEFPHPVVAVAALDGRGRVCLVRQWRYPWGRDSWEVPAGRCEEGETPLEGAQRELREEAGVTAGEWSHLFTFYASASISTQYHVFLASNITHVQAQRDHEEQDMIVTWVPLADAVQAVLDGRIVHSSAIAILLRLEREVLGRA